MKKLFISNIIVCVIFIPLFMMAKICFPGITVCANVTVSNNSAKTITAIAKRVGCLGAAGGELITCRSMNIASLTKAVLDIKYPYTDDYEIIIHTVPSAEYNISDVGSRQELRYVSTKKVGDGAYLNFPQDFIWDAPNDEWITPDPRLRFDEVCFVGSHNAHVSRDDGWVLYHQQIWSIEKQLQKGVRHLLLDFWDDDGVGRLCHGDCKTASLPPRVGVAPHTINSILRTIKKFLDDNRNAIVSLELENYLSGDRTYQEFKSVPGLENYILKHTDYEPLEHDGYWPTLQWLIDHNKRLIIFDTQDNQKYAFDTDKYLRRNMYGTLDVEKACELRGSSSPQQKLYQLNYFGTVSAMAAQDNSLPKLKVIYERCKQKGVVSSSHIPNFLALDFSHTGDPFKYANIINWGSAKKKGLIRGAGAK